PLNEVDNQLSLSERTTPSLPSILSKRREESSAGVSRDVSSPHVASTNSCQQTVPRTLASHPIFRWFSRLWPFASPSFLSSTTTGWIPSCSSTGPLEGSRAPSHLATASAVRLPIPDCLRSCLRYIPIFSPAFSKSSASRRGPRCSGLYR